MATSAYTRQRSVPCCAGPNESQVAAFRAKLSDPTALKSQFSYHYSASLITDGLANGTDPLYVYTMPRCSPAQGLCLLRQCDNHLCAALIHVAVYCQAHSLLTTTSGMVLHSKAPLRFYSCIACSTTLPTQTAHLCRTISYDLHATQIHCHSQCTGGCCGSSAVCSGLQPQSLCAGRRAPASRDRST